LHRQPTEQFFWPNLICQAGPGHFSNMAWRDSTPNRVQQRRGQRGTTGWLFGSINLGSPVVHCFFLQAQKQRRPAVGKCFGSTGGDDALSGLPIPNFNKFFILFCNF
jgi:hypothetical protein